MAIPIEIESILKRLELRYNKQVDTDGRESFCLPFDTSVGALLVRLYSEESVFSPYAFLRTLDSTGVSSKRDLLLDVMKLNAGSTGFARVGVWVSPDTEKEWLIVRADVVPGLLSPDSVKCAILDTAQLCEQVLQAVAAHVTAASQKKLP
jgi:hypothetical protein